jgi:hypothetical protein
VLRVGRLVLERAAKPEKAFFIRSLPHSPQEWLSSLLDLSRNSVVTPQSSQMYS